MTRATCLAWLCFTACVGGDGPRLLADIPGLELLLAASPVRARVEIDYQQHVGGSGACVVLHESFRATVNGAEMPIEHRGSEDSTADCQIPMLRLDRPPTAELSTLVLVDDSRELRIGLSDLIAPRSIQLVPDGPWSFAVGQPVTARYTPSTDLYKASSRLMLRTDPFTAGQEIPFTASSDELTFVVPDRPGAWPLELHTGTAPQPWPCPDDVACSMVEPPRLVQPIEIRPRPAI